MSEKVVEFHPKATAEARAAYNWYRERSHAASDAFLAEIDLALDKIVKSPLARAEYIAGTRRYLFRRFPFSIVYRVSSDVIEVIAVAHARRRPGYWAKRLPNQ
jgi:plasmid stabilization system protein ParE